MDEFLVHEEDYKGHHIRIHKDDFMVESPREWNNFGHMLCFHSRYDLGDKHDERSEEFDGWSAIEEHLHKVYGACIIIPLRLYDHSGISMSTHSHYPYNCPWDSGQVGFYYVNKAEVLKEFKRKNWNDNLRRKATELMESEVKVYDMYLRGEVYSFTISHDVKCGKCGHTEDVHNDSCGGYYGHDTRAEMITECKGIIDGIIFDAQQLADIATAHQD